MGVPGFYADLTRENKSIIVNNINKIIDYLFFDANCAFHPQCFKVLAQHVHEKDIDRLEDAMINRILAYIDYIIGMIIPRKLAYIAVDGIAPVAKVSQQRNRRFESANNYKQEIYHKFNIDTNDSWSNIVITPGTSFMYKLHNKLDKYYTNKINACTDKKCTYEMIYNSYKTPGEGEHKILQYIKDNIPKNNKSATIIYGLDADLIFLAMASQYDNIYLLRESNQFGGKNTANGDPFAIEEELVFADIDKSKKFINEKFNSQYNDGTQVNVESDMFASDDESDNKHNQILNNKQNYHFINDYIFICYFLGNDFLPHLPSIDIRMKGLQYVQETYMSTFIELGYNLITIENEKVRINNTFLLKFITGLASKEEDFFKSIQPDSLRFARRRPCNETEPHKRAIWAVENLKNITINDPVMLGKGDRDDWRFRYYSHYMKTHEHMEETVNDMCKNYLEGLVWVARYYFESCPTWRWQYKYTHAPFLSDIMRYLSNYDIMKDFNTEYQPPIEMYSQLVSVIPPAFSYVLPEQLRYLNSSPSSPIIDMYPISYNVDMINKTQLYKCIPMIPYLDVQRVIDQVNKVKLSEKYSEMCSLSKPFYLGKCHSKEGKKTK